MTWCTITTVLNQFGDTISRSEEKWAHVLLFSSVFCFLQECPISWIHFCKDHLCGSMTWELILWNVEAFYGPKIPREKVLRPFAMPFLTYWHNVHKLWVTHWMQEGAFAVRSDMAYYSLKWWRRKITRKLQALNLPAPTSIGNTWWRDGAALLTSDLKIPWHYTNLWNMYRCCFV